MVRPFLIHQTLKFFCKLHYILVKLLVVLHVNTLFATLFFYPAMPLDNESIDDYLFKRAKAGGFDSPIKSKRIWTKTNRFIDEQVIKVLDKPKKGKKRKVTKKHDLEYNSDEENLNRLKSKYCTESKKMGNKKMKAVENDEIKKRRIFIADDDSDSKNDEHK